MPWKRPDLATVRTLFKEHLDIHRQAHDNFRIRDLGGEQALIRDYSGRVVFELLQNALDRAQNRIVIWMLPKTNDSCAKLIVGNDGHPVRVHKRLASGDGAAENRGASDFHALLSLHSSTKSAATSIGNKGVGFRSVFGSSPRVEVWSRSQQGPWWCLLMRHPLRWTEIAGQRPNEQWSSQEVASFYCPESIEKPDTRSIAARLGLSEYDVEVLDGLETLVVLPELTDGAPSLRNGERPALRDVENSIRQLQLFPLAFLDERCRGDRANLAIKLRIGTECVPPKRLAWDDGWIEKRGMSVPLNDPIRQNTGLDLDNAQVRIALPPESSSLLDAPNTALYWSYLPTEQHTGHGIQIHGDFYLSNSRRAVVFADKEGDTAQGFNRRVLRSASEAIVLQLWDDPRVLRRNDFWRLASPRSCDCPALRREVARQVFQEKNTFKRIVTGAFQGNPEEHNWDQQRYRDFFRALEDWARYAYEAGFELPDGGKGLNKWHTLLLRWTHETQAAVIPIIESVNADDVCLVRCARPMPRLSSGPKQEIIYLRRTAGEPLPDVVARQDTWVTAFQPPGNGKTSDFGLTDFSRVELLARLRPVSAEETGCEDLLRVALRIGNERQEVGGLGSVLDRAINTRRGSAWALAAGNGAQKDAFVRAGLTLRELLVPVRGGGWKPAGQTTYPPDEALQFLSDATDWPWPQLDVERLSVLLPQLAEIACDSGRRKAIDDACVLLGISRGPLLVEKDGQLVLDQWSYLTTKSADVRKSLAAALLVHWDLHAGQILPHIGDSESPPSRALVEQLESTPWLPTDTDERFDEHLVGGRLTMPRPGMDWISPKSLWLQSSRGFRTEVLPSLRVKDGQHIPKWAGQLRVEDVSNASNDRIHNALKELRTGFPDVAGVMRDLVELYTRLIKSYNESEGRDWSDLPVLVRRYGERGRVKEVDWRRADESVWFDNGDNTSELTAFSDISVWVVRRSNARIAERLGIKAFRPVRTLKPSIAGDPLLAERFRERLREALPDVFAALGVVEHLVREFDAEQQEQVLRNWVSLEVRHWKDVAEEYHFDSRTGAWGVGEQGNVFLRREADASPELAFDGSDLDALMIEAKMPLALALCEDRAFISVFEQVLRCWSRRSESGGNSEPPAAVLRMRRDSGVTDKEIEAWAHRIDAATLTDKEKKDWHERVSRALARFGSPRSSAISLGRVITPETWEAVFGQTDKEAVCNALRETMQNASEAVQRVQPTVDFLGYHCSAFVKMRNERKFDLIADAVCTKESQAWTERLREELLEKVDAAVTAEERTAFGQIQCDVERLLRLRIGAPSAGDKSDPQWRNAFLFAQGQIELRGLPRPEPTGQLRIWQDGPAQTVLGPLSEAEWLKQNRRKVSGGGRAEDAVLVSALRNAVDWLTSNPADFWQSVERDLLFARDRLAREKVQRQIAAAKRESAFVGDSEARLRNLLHVSSWWGNAGFDVIVPTREDAGWLMNLVEVKRVASIKNATFFLSENERQQACAHLDSNRRWQLWLVASDGLTRDVTWVLAQFNSAGDAIGQLLSCGIRPGEYMLQLE
jgi:hypothetical protein